MNTLDCSNYQSTLRSASSILEMREDTLVNILRELPDTPNISDGYLDYFDELLFHLNYKYKEINAMWFHGTRILNAKTFFDAGLLPKSEAYKTLTPLLTNLAQSIEYKESSSPLLSLSKAGKTSIGADDEGPFATLFKQKVQHENYSFHQMPEAVADIAESLVGANHRILTQRFLDITRPAIVEFAGHADDNDLINSIYYLHQIIHGENETEVTYRINAYFKGEGKIISGNKIKQITFLDNDAIISNENWG